MEGEVDGSALTPGSAGSLTWCHAKVVETTTARLCCCTKPTNTHPSVVSIQRVDWQQEAPSFEDRQVREVYARFGLAAYCGQCVERALGMVLATMYGEHSDIVWWHEFDRVLEGEFAKTLGRMAKDLSKSVDLPSAFEGRLRHAVTERNRLMHSYFWDSAVKFASADGREAMIAELQEAADFLSSFDDELNEILQTWLDSVGVSSERVRRELRRLEQQARVEDPSDA